MSLLMGGFPNGWLCPMNGVKPSHVGDPPPNRRAISRRRAFWDWSLPSQKPDRPSAAACLDLNLTMWGDSVSRAGGSLVCFTLFSTATNFGGRGPLTFAIARPAATLGGAV